MKITATFNPAVRFGRRAARKPSQAQGVVYFITCQMPDFPIKIGFASDLTPRLASIQTSLPFAIKLLYATPGSRKTEREIGEKFAIYRLRGEWFKPTQMIFDYIDELRHAANEAQRAIDAAEAITINAPWLPTITQLRLGIL